MGQGKLPQDDILVKVEFYDDKEEQKLLSDRYPLRARKEMTALVGSNIKIPMSEFLTYYLAHRQGTAGYGDFDEIRASALEIGTLYVNGVLRFTGTSICLPEGSGSPRGDVVERVGEAVSLSVISRIHGLNEADWQHLGPMHGPQASPTFDFQLPIVDVASDGKTVIQVESKGSSVESNDRKESAISNQKRSILRKKKTLGSGRAADIYPATVRYGAVVSLDRRPDHPVKCLLVDPDADTGAYGPEELRLLKRMSFLQSLFAVITPRLPMAAALSTRVSDLRRLANPFELDGSPLRRGSGEPIEFTMSGDTSSFLNGRSRVSSGGVHAAGIVISLARDRVFLFGVRQELASIAAKQDFTAVMGFNFSPRTAWALVECVVPVGRADEIDLPTGTRSRAGYQVFDVEGEVHFAPSGVTFAYLSLLAAR